MLVAVVAAMATNTDTNTAIGIDTVTHVESQGIGAKCICRRTYIYMFRFLDSEDL